MKKYTQEALVTYAELVRLIGSQAYAFNEGRHYWTLVFDGCSDIGLEIELSTKNDNTVISMYEVEISELDDTTSIKDDVINTIVGYACMHNIQLTYGETVYVNIDRQVNK